VNTYLSAKRVAYDCPHVSHWNGYMAAAIGKAESDIGVLPEVLSPYDNGEAG
jgi:hypothetical protein